MTVLPDIALHTLGPEMIDPFDHDKVQPASYDLSLFDEFIVFTSSHLKYIDLDNVLDSSEKIKFGGKNSEDGQSRETHGLVLHPGEFVLGATEEKITVPNNIVARLEGKSSIGRLGLMIHVTAGFVDPGWSGRLTLEICNLRRVPIILRPGKTFCQISFQYMSSSARKPYSGRYQGACGVDASKYGKYDLIGGVSENFHPEDH